MSKIIYQTGDQISGFPQLGWKAWSVSDEYYTRLMHGERPVSWEQLLLPDRAKFHTLTSGSELWQHISQYTPSAAMLLYIALTASSQLDQTVVLENIKDMMHLVVTQLGSDHALHSTTSQVSPEKTLADMLDEILSESFFGWRYEDLL